jgi:hypothetical protein
LIFFGNPRPQHGSRHECHVYFQGLTRKLFVTAACATHGPFQFVHAAVRRACGKKAALAHVCLHCEPPLRIDMSLFLLSSCPASYMHVWHVSVSRVERTGPKGTVGGHENQSDLFLVFDSTYFLHNICLSRFASMFHAVSFRTPSPSSMLGA